MKRARIPQILPLALLASAAVWAAPTADQRSGAAPVAVSGMFSVTFNIEPVSSAVAGGLIECKAKIAPRLSAFENLSGDVAPVASAAGVASPVAAGPAGSSVNCSVEIPFAWLVNDRGNGIALSYEIDAVSGSGVAALRTQQPIGMAYPVAGGTANVNLHVRF